MYDVQENGLQTYYSGTSMVRQVGEGGFSFGLDEVGIISCHCFQSIID